MMSSTSGAAEGERAPSGRAPRWLVEEPDLEALVGVEAVLPSEDVVASVLTRLAADDPAGLGQVSPQVLLGVVAAVARGLARGQQILADLAAAVAKHPHVHPDPRFPSPAEADEAAAGELSFVLGITPFRARALVTKGRRLNNWLLPVGEQARAGLLDASRTSVFVEELAGAPLEPTLAVLDRVLPHAGGQTPGRLRSSIRRTLAMVDPEGEGVRARVALAGRCVRPLRPAAGGMAIFSALLPAVGAAALDHACEAAAKAAKAAGDPRTLDQARADALVAMGQQALLSGQIGLPEPVGPRAPMGLAGPRGVTEASVGARPRRRRGSDDVFRFDPSGARVRIVATDEAAAGADPITDAWDMTPAQAVAHELDPATDAVLVERATGLPRPGLEVPELAGYGPLLPSQVAAVLERRWVEVEPPPDEEELEPPAESSYRPSRRLRQFVRRRDGSCQAPGCSVPARWCDVHHVLRWPDGPTAAWNLRAVCRRHHNLLTHGGHAMRVVRHEFTGTTTTVWTTRLGLTRYRLPDGRCLTEPQYVAYVRGLDPPPLPETELEPEWDSSPEDDFGRDGPVPELHELDPDPLQGRCDVVGPWEDGPDVPHERCERV